MKDELHILDEFPFEFHESIFSVYLAADRKIYVPLSDLCTAMNIDTFAQTQRIQRSEVIGDALVKLPLQVPYGEEGAMQTREILCLWLNRLPYWLGTIDAARIPDQSRRQTVVRFQREFADVAWAAFRTQIMPEDVLAEMDATLPPQQQQYLATMDAAAHMRQKLARHEEELRRQGASVDEIQERLGALEARFLGTDFINSAQKQRYIVMVNLVASLLKNRKEGTHETVHAHIKETIEVPSYRLIPEDDFPRVVSILAAWYQRLTPPGTPLPQVFELPDQKRLL